jgi:hypothetical protein
MSPLTAEIVTRLRRAGAQVELLAPEDGPWDVAALRPQHDLYVLKGSTSTTFPAIVVCRTPPSAWRSISCPSPGSKPDIDAR